jgi:hypothetical protein
VLKNSVFEADEKFSACQTNQSFFDTKGYRKQLKGRYGASGAVSCPNSIGLSNETKYGRKPVFFGFGVFQQNRPTAEISGAQINTHSSSAIWRQPGIDPVQWFVSVVDPQ